MKIFDILLIIVLIISLFGLGWECNNIYSSYNLDRELNGLWLHNYNQTEAKEKAYELDGNGDWVMININGMSIQEMISTCQHEASHEIFSENCEDDPIKCLEMIGVKNETN